MVAPEPASLPLSAVNWQDTSFNLLPDTWPDQIPGSTGPIAFPFQTGLPLVQCWNNMYRILDGRDRLRAQLRIAEQNARKAHVCFVVTEEMDQAGVWELILQARSLATPLSPVECAVFLKKIRAIATEREVNDRFLPLLPKEYHRLRPASFDYVLELPQSLQTALHCGKISETAARLLASEEHETATSFVRIITTLKLGGNKQKNFVQGCREIALREDVSLREILREISKTGILSDHEPNPPQQAARLLAWLSQRLHPRLQQAENRWRHFVSQLELPGPVSCVHSPSFERDEVTFSITCPTKEAAQQLWQAIKAPVQKALLRSP